MDKISLRTIFNFHTQANPFARLSRPAALPKTAADDANPLLRSGANRVRSKDGDTFTLSPEARALRNTRAIGPEAAVDVEVSRRHHFPRLGDPEDVADTLLGRLDQDHAAAGGSRAEFVEAAMRKLSGWKASGEAAGMNGTNGTEEYREFRNQVHLKLTEGLEAWAMQSGSASGADSLPSR